MTQSAQSPVSRLVLFMVCLSVAGAFVAGLHYYAVDQPQQNAVQAPENKFNEVYYKCQAEMEAYCEKPTADNSVCSCIQYTCYEILMGGYRTDHLDRYLANCYRNHRSS